MAAVWGAVERPDDHTLRRWQLAAEASGTLGLLLRGAEARHEPSWAEWKLWVEPVAAATATGSQTRGTITTQAALAGNQRRVRVELLRARSGRAGAARKWSCQNHAAISRKIFPAPGEAPMKGSPLKRALCIWLPNWPLQRLAAARSELREQSVLLYQLHSSGGAKVTAFCPRLDRAAWALWDDAWEDRAARRGIRPGMPLAEATALLSLVSAGGPRDTRGEVSEKRSAPTVHVELADPSADRLALEELASWCHAFSPSVSIEEAAEPESLLLDVTGLGPLFGGEAVLVQHVIEQFAERHLLARVTLADTLTAAWGIAHFAPVTSLRSTGASSPRVRIHSKETTPPCPVRFSPLVIPPEETADALFPLPPAALGLPPETCDVLSQLGLTRIEQLAVLPRESLLARFGPLVLCRLDQAMGQAAEAIVACAVPPEWQFDWPFEYPTARLAAITAALEQLLARVCAAMARERRGVLRLECVLTYERQPAERWCWDCIGPAPAPSTWVTCCN